ncbi:MAG TPA: hypothetical protein VME66_10120 [Candidatus Acidoferrales bacterium]|nr:hypothetical protein [Candidatus Acidoferrales bacterium]
MRSAISLLLLLCLGSAPALPSFPPEATQTSATPTPLLVDTIVPARGTYPLTSIGKPGTPKLTAAQIAFARRVMSSVRYRKFVRDLRFILIPGPEPLTIYDRCGGGWGMVRDCSVPPGETSAGGNYHVVGASCDTTLNLAGATYAPHIFLRRDIGCDTLPDDLAQAENLDIPYRECYVLQGEKLARCINGSSAQSTPPPPGGTIVPARGTYPLTSIGKPGTPKLTAAQIAFARRVISSVRYRKFVRDLRFILIPTGDKQVPLAIYDRCGGGWGEPRDCADVPPGNETEVGAPYHVIGGSCNTLLFLTGLDAPEVVAGRDPRCDVLPVSIGESENLDLPYRECDSMWDEEIIRCLEGK